MEDDAKATAANLAAEFEGFSSVPYMDPVGVWTIGYGSTRDAYQKPVTSETQPITEAQAKALLSRDMWDAFRTVAGEVSVALTDNQWAALGDFVYNLGSGNFRASTLLRKLNAGDYDGAADEFEKWDMAGGKHLAGLLRRRAAEKAMFDG